MVLNIQVKGRVTYLSLLNQELEMMKLSEESMLKTKLG